MTETAHRLHTRPVGSHEDEDFVFRVVGRSDHPWTIYVPGVHGCWTPQAHAQPILTERLRLVEITYPRQPRWTVEDYARALERLMDRLKIESAHIVAESFGSLVGWRFGLERPERVKSLVVVGGFCQTPGPQMVHLARLGLSLLPTELFERGVNAYVRLRRHQGKLTHPEYEVDLPYMAVRTRRGRRATIRRFELIGQADFRDELHAIRFPVRYIGGEADIIVPVRREIQTLRELLPADADFKSRLISGAPHMIVSSHPEETAGQILEWIWEAESGRTGLARDAQKVREGEPL